MNQIVFALAFSLITINANTLCGQETTTIPRGSIAFTQPVREIHLAAAEPGRIAAIIIRRGSRVTKGQLLVELDTSALFAARETMLQRATSMARKEALEVELGRKVRMYETLKGLSVEGAGTTEELLDAEAEAKVAGFNVQAEVEKLQTAMLEIREIDAKIELRRIRAQMDGVIVDIFREAGEYVAATDAKVATLVDLSRLRASFFLPTSVAEKLKAGSQVQLQFVRSRTIATATIEYVGPLTQADSGRVRVDVLVDNTGQKYRSGLQCILPQNTDAITKELSSRLKSVQVPNATGYQR